MFQAIYDSPWHSPAFFWLVGAAFVIAIARRLPWLTAHLLLFQLVVFADALATGAWPPAGLASSAWMTPLAITFVILGDLRFFALVERFARGAARPMPLGAWGAVLGWSLLVPVASSAAKLAVPRLFAEPRITFLTYELMFLALATALRLVVLPRRLAATTAGIRGWLLGVASYEIVQYALWALADVLILSGVGAGFLLRVVPNSLYYAFFLPFVWWTAPPEART